MGGRNELGIRFLSRIFPNCYNSPLAPFGDCRKGRPALCSEYDEQPSAAPDRAVMMLETRGSTSYHFMEIDVLIIGGGPGGAAAAMFLLREGITPVILEQEEFPRYHIGESATGEAGQVLRRLGFEDEMVKREHPVKHGVKVFGTSGVNSWYIPVSKRDADW